LKFPLGLFPFTIFDLSFAMLGLVEFRSLVQILHTVAQHTVDQSSPLGRHGRNRDRSAQLGSQSAEQRSDIGVA
jgi:hypothetical protein